jgi:chaperonin GroES
LIERLDAPVAASALLEVVKLDDEPSGIAQVISVGNGARQEDGTRRPLDVAINNIIVTKHYCGTPVTIDGKDLHIIMEDDILAILVED